MDDFNKKRWRIFWKLKIEEILFFFKGVGILFLLAILLFGAWRFVCVMNGEYGEELQHTATVCLAWVMSIVFIGILLFGLLCWLHGNWEKAGRLARRQR